MSNKNKSPSAEDYLKAFMKMEKAASAKRQKTDAEKVQELLGENTEVVYDGKVVYSLNSSLVLRQGLDVSELRNLKCLHAEKLKYFDLMKQTDDRKQLKEYAKEIEFIEFEMQKNWHFGQDRNFHEWYKVPKCTCPKIDNADSRGTNHRIINMNCPVHS